MNDDVGERSPAGQVLVAAGGPCPTDELGRPRSLFRAGDVLRVACPMVETLVVDDPLVDDPDFDHDDDWLLPTNELTVLIRWPWPSSRPGWEGEIAFDRDRNHPDAGWLFRFTPDLEVLASGDRCRVGIRPTTVHVLAVDSSPLPPISPSADPAAPGLSLRVLPAGVPYDLARGAYGDAADSLSPYGDEPIRVELLFRPYRFLEDLDVVADQQGRRWVFCRPYWWVELDRDDDRQGLPAPLAGPDWPVTLLGQVGGAAPDPNRVGQVAEATAAGDHTSHLAVWSRMAGVEPWGIEHQGMPEDRTHPPLDERRTSLEREGTRTALQGMTFTQILCACMHTWHRRRQLITHQGEVETLTAVARLDVRLAEMASVLRQLRASGAPVYAHPSPSQQ
jgi:hypothetical protein